MFEGTCANSFAKNTCSDQTLLCQSLSDVLGIEDLIENVRKTWIICAEALSLLRLTFPSNMAVQTLGHVV